MLLVFSFSFQVSERNIRYRWQGENGDQISEKIVT